MRWVRAPALVGLALCGLLLTGCSRGSGSAPASFPADINSAQPTWLTAGSMVPDSVLTGTANRPALTSEGDSVRVELPGGSVLATVVGPEVPGEGLPEVTATTTCTWTVTLTSATGTVPVAVADFTTMDSLGTVYRPRLLAGHPAPPSTVRPGRTVTFQLRAVMRTGEALMRWAPDGKDLVASWDFVVEND